MQEFTTIEPETGQRTRLNNLPDYVSTEQIHLSANSIKVLEKRYLRRDENGDPLETVAGMFYRIAYCLSLVEPTDHWQVIEKFYRLMAERRFYPNSPTFTGAGTPLGQLAACFVLAIEDDMGGKSPEGIFNTLRNAALIQQTGGGNGFSFSRLRPKGDLVRASNGKATGPVGFLGVYDRAFGEIAQGGSRRGANMCVLRCDHPDIEEFIECKAQEGKLTNFNISVGITDKFMLAVKDDESFDLVNPRDGKVWKTVRAKSLFDKIVKYAFKNGEPGMLFLDAANRSNPVPHLYELEATNPCGEQWLGPYENCCLGSINLAVHIKADEGGETVVDWKMLQKTIEESTHFLDNVVSANKYVPAVPELKEAALRARRIGLGVMGLADLMYMLGIHYGSGDSLDFVGQIMEFVRFHCMATSIRLAAERGVFTAYPGSIYDRENMQWQPPTPLRPLTAYLGRPDLDWNSLLSDLKTYGIRNACQTTIAPTGTISTVCGCEGYGCEPVFALGYTRHFKDGDKDVELLYTSPLFDAALARISLSDKLKAEIRRQVATYGTCQDISELPEEIRRIFVVSADISAEQHVWMQAAMQAFVDNSLSKTCNFPETASEQDVADAYLLAWKLGCKGLTVYVAGSREQVVLETKATKEKLSTAVVVREMPVKKSRPPVLAGKTYRKETPIGRAYVTINSNGDGPTDPLEVFLTVGKAGSEINAVSEALGRLMSLLLRVPSSLDTQTRLAMIADELAGIGGGRPMGLGPNRVKSLPDGVAQVLIEHLRPLSEQRPVPLGLPVAYVSGDICPECGEAAMIETEGCRKCFACGYAEC